MVDCERSEHPSIVMLRSYHRPISKLSELGAKAAIEQQRYSKRDAPAPPHFEAIGIVTSPSR
jgi:hypothetical protein